jgi:riboflavin biosynthesis pyrimidine reductase
MADESAAFRVDRLWPDPARDLDLDAAFADLELPDPPAGRPLVGINMITTIDGRAQLAGTAEGLGSRVDRRLMRLLRADHDAVGSGAGTLHAAGLWTWLPPDLAERRAREGKPPQPLAVLLAGDRLVDPGSAWFRADQPRLVVLGPRAAAEQPPLPGATEILVAPDELPDPAWALGRLGERGVESVLLEGGPHINAAFLAAGLIDEVYWTVSASLTGDHSLPMISPIQGGSPWARRPRRGRLVSVHRSGDELFLRYRFV